MPRLILYLVLLVLFARAVNRLWHGILEGMQAPGRGSSSVPQRGVQMVRDPVCGTFVVPDRALSLSVGREELFFCSAACRDAYRARTA
jgi:YHS domain-containing protein